MDDRIKNEKLTEKNNKDCPHERTTWELEPYEEKCSEIYGQALEEICLDCGTLLGRD